MNQMNATPVLSLILPVYNQADHVREAAMDMFEALAGLGRSFEVILVTNACRDGSSEACAMLARKCPEMRHIDSPRGGWGHAVLLGLNAARGELVCYTNLARTTANDLSLILMYALANPGTVVKANRKIREGVVRRFGSLLYNLQCRALFDLSVWDINGTPKVFPRTFDRLFDLKREDDLIDIEFNVICKRNGYRILEVPIFSSCRRSGRSTTNWKSALRMYRGAWRMWRELKSLEE